MDTPIEIFQEQHKNCPNPNQWTDLPKDVLLRIIQYLDLKTDVPRLRGVCPAWRSAVPLHELPVHKYYLQVPNLDPNNKVPLFLLETKFYLFTPLLAGDGNCGSWIARLGETGTNKLQLLSPLDCYQYKIGHKYIYTEPHITGEINLLDCHVHELARPVRLVEELDHNAKSLSKKVVGEWDFTSSRFFTVLVQLETCVLGEEDKFTSNLFLLRSWEKEWVEVPCNDLVDDIAFHKGKFYVCFYNWQVGVINPCNSSMTIQYICGPNVLCRYGFSLEFPCNRLPDCIEVDGSIIEGMLNFKLVPSKSNGCLYFIIHAPENMMLVFMMKDLENKWEDWERVENLGDDIIFIGDFVSFAYPSSAMRVNLPDRILNSICYLCGPKLSGVYRGQGENAQMPQGAEYLNHLIYMSNDKYFYFLSMENGVSRFIVMHKQDKEMYGRLFFPPPAWVKWRCPSLGNVEVRLDGLPFQHDPYKF